jgi:fructose-1,6-bisphosphatase/inositol monophosphatase family enzyme
VNCGTPLLAVVHTPATLDTFSAVWGRGARQGILPIRVREGTCLEASRTGRRGEFATFARDWDVRLTSSIALLPVRHTRMRVWRTGDGVAALPGAVRQSE